MTSEQWGSAERLLLDTADWSEHVAHKLRCLAEYGKESTEVIDVELSTLALLMARQAAGDVSTLHDDVNKLVTELAECLEDVKAQLAA